MRCPVGYPGFCYYDLKHRANVYNCSSTDLKTLPVSVPNFTDWVWLENNKIQNLHGNMSYLKSIGYLNVNSNKITIMNGCFMSALLQSQTLKWLNLAFNDITNLPVNVQNLTHLEKIWLSGNPFHCDCEMTWMIGCLNNFTKPSKEHVIVDYQDIKCHSGKMKGKPIYKLNVVKMGCFPSRMTTL